MWRAFLVALTAWALFQGNSPASHPSDNVWDSLTERTGWVVLGERSADDQQWTTYTFRAHPNQSDWPLHPPPLLPNVGDQIEIRSISGVQVLDYRQTGERLRFVMPEGTHSNDRTDVVLPIGAVVVVRNIRREPRTSGTQEVRARVSPVDFDDSRFDGWFRLQHQTGWIHLGDAPRLERDLERLARLEYFSVLSPLHAIPSVGSRVQLASPARLYLRDFLTAGEARRLEVPNVVRAGANDFAGAVLPAGSDVEILEIAQGPSTVGAGTFVAFWARVSPAREDRTP